MPWKARSIVTGYDKDMSIMDILRNKSKELKELFCAMTIRKAKERFSVTPVYGSSYSGESAAYARAVANGTFKVHFYEWSDISREPRVFTSLGTFLKFLRECDIPIAYWEENLIRSLVDSYVTCKKGSKTLVIRGRYAQLVTAME